MTTGINASSLLKTSKVASTTTTSNAQKAAAATSTNSTKSTEKTGTIASTTSTEQLKEELAALQKEKEVDVQKMEKIEQQIQTLAKEAQENILEAAKKQEAAVEEHEQEAKKALNENIEAYIAANKEGGKGMTKDELQANIKKSMPDAPGLGTALAKLAAASSEIAQIDSLLGSLNSLILDVQGINLDISSKQAEYDSAVKAAEAKKCCDPIGFTLGEGKNQVRYDFIVDDGSFDTTSDFLGADNQWAEMEALDLDKNGTVTAQELSQGKIKAVKTTPDGKQEVVDIAKELGDDFTIDLSSYTQGGTHSSIDTAADFDKDGVIDQNLLGTFNVNVKGESVKGYNTLDDVDFLNKQYGVAIDTDQQTASSVTSDDELASHTNFFEEYTKKSQELTNQLNEGLTSLGISEENITAIKQEALNEGTKEANIFMQKLEEEQKEQEAQEAKEKEAKETQAKKDEEAQAAKEKEEAQQAKEDEEIQNKKKLEEEDK